MHTKLKLGTHLDNGWMHRVYQNQAAALIHPFIFSFFFLSNFQTLKIFVTLFSGKALKVETWYIREQLMDVSCKPESGCYFLFIPFFFFFFLSHSQAFKILVKFFMGTVRPRRLKLGTHVNDGWMYCVYWNQGYCLFFPFFLHFSFSLILKHLTFSSLFSGTVRPRRLNLGTHTNNGWMYRV